MKPCSLHPNPDPALKPYVVTTKTNAVWFGFCLPGDLKNPEYLHLRGARNAYYWKCSGGIGQLSSRGPEVGSKIGDRCDVILTDPHAFHPCTLEAVAAWETVSWA